MRAMIRFDNVTKVLGGRTILNGISLEIRAGEVFVLVGSSGTGKSVTLKHMVRLMTPDDGDVYIGEDCISEMGSHQLERVRERFGYLFQGGALLAWMSVADNVALPLREKTDMPEDEIGERVQQTLGMVGLENDGDKMPSAISGGMQKRAGLARAIIRNPEIVLYDEPTSGLDPVTADELDELIIQLSRTLSITFVIVTHELPSIYKIADRVIMLDARTKKIIAEGNPEELKTSADDEWVRNFFNRKSQTTVSVGDNHEQ